MSELLRDQVGQVLPLNAPEPLATATAREQLRSIDAGQTVFVVADSTSLGELMASDGWRDLSQAGLELVNPRIWGRTLYVFARGGNLDPRSALKGWVRWAGPAHPEVRARAAAALRRLGYTNVTFETMNVARRMVDGFDLGGAAGGVDIVCIYDEEPSAFLDSFVSAILTPARLLLLEPEPGDSPLSVRDGLPSVTVPYEAQRFYVMQPRVSVASSSQPGRPASVVITPPPDVVAANESRLPLILTNARRTGDLAAIEKSFGRRLDQIASQAYVRSLFEAGVSRCNERDPVSAAQFKTVLLNAFFAERNDPYTVLALSAHLEYARRMRIAEPGEADPIAVLRRMLSADYKLTGTDSAALVRWLKQQTGQSNSNMRARFAGYPDERIYKDAITAMRAAIGESRPVERRQILAQARDRLVALAEAAPVSTCGLTTPDRGLWSAIDFEPFFFLAVIDAMSRPEPRR